MGAKITIVEGNSNDKDNVRNYMVKGEKGSDGVSPSASVTRGTNSATVTVTDAEGTTSAVLNDGYSPTVTATKVEKTTTITMTDINGTTTAEIKDGIDLTGGVPTNGVIAFDGVSADVPNGYEVTTTGFTTLDQVYPIGSIYMSVNNTSPSTLFGGTWEQLKDRFLLGAGDTYTAGDTGGEATHTLTTNEMPSHNHKLTSNTTSGSADSISVLSISSGSDNNITTKISSSVGGGQAHNNMPPYLTVYMWKRTA